jgi:ubiquinone/menaquinone biosynthesis C-methylase UbiE
MNPNALHDTGERMMPKLSSDDTFWEHIERYRFAARYAKGRDVLDIACGEGYGSAALMRAGASSVIGVDVSEAACAHARARHGVDARVGDAEAIPLGSGAVDAVVSFETIEHVGHPDLFLQECARVLRPGGLLVISTPNKEVYREQTPNNPFHCSEMSYEQYRCLVSRFFRIGRVFGQCTPLAWYWSLRGFWRFSNALRRVSDPMTALPLTEEIRGRTTELILRRVNPVVDALSMFGVKRSSASTLSRSKYLIAVAYRWSN